MARAQPTLNAVHPLGQAVVTDTVPQPIYINQKHANVTTFAAAPLNIRNAHAHKK